MGSFKWSIIPLGFSSDIDQHAFIRHLKEIDVSDFRLCVYELPDDR
jgi:hypothetical protein